MRRCFTLCTFILFLLSACAVENNKQENLVASAFGNKLYSSELENLFTSELSASDSSSLIKKYIDNWLMQEILYNEAQKKIKTEDKIEQLVESYKKSLYINELEKVQLASQLDTLISVAELDTFYSQHKQDFLIDEEIVRILFVKVPEEFDNEKFGTLWKTENLPALKVFVNAIEGIHLLNIDRWYYLSEIKNLTPSALINKINFDKTESYSLTQDGSRFLLRVLDYTKANEVAPKSFAMEKIKLRLLHDRSTNLLNKWKKELFQNNIQSKSITIPINE